MFEFNDQTWLPRLLRCQMTEFLDYLSGFMGRYVEMSTIVADVMEEAGTRTIIDLCSGSSRTAIALRDRVERRLGEEVTVVLTDKFPVDGTAGDRTPRVVWEGRCVDAMGVPEDLQGIRTLFTSFHHFRGEDAVRLVRDAVESGQPVAIFEHADRGAWVKTKLALTTPPLVAASFTRRRMTPGGFFVNFVVPLVPAMLIWDGFVSVDRTYSIAEMRRIIERAGISGYHWSIGRTASVGRAGRGPLYFAVGHSVPAVAEGIVETVGALPKLAGKHRGAGEAAEAVR